MKSGTNQDWITISSGWINPRLLSLVSLTSCFGLFERKKRSGNDVGWEWTLFSWILVMVLFFVANLCWRLWSGRLYILKHNYINIHHIIQIFAYTMLHPSILSYLSYTFKALQADFSARDAEQTATIWGFVCCFYHQKSRRKNPSSFNSLYIDIYWQGSLCYQPKQCTRKWTIPQIYHTFALFDLINMGPTTATRTTTTSYAKQACRQGLFLCPFPFRCPWQQTFHLGRGFIEEKFLKQCCNIEWYPPNLT